jgi:hypothetical protein
MIQTTDGVLTAASCSTSAAVGDTGAIETSESVMPSTHFYLGVAFGYASAVTAWRFIASMFTACVDNKFPANNTVATGT